MLLLLLLLLLVVQAVPVCKASKLAAVAAVTTCPSEVNVPSKITYAAGGARFSCVLTL